MSESYWHVINWAMILLATEPGSSERVVLDLRFQLSPNLGDRISLDPGDRLSPNPGLSLSPDLDPSLRSDSGQY